MLAYKYYIRPRDPAAAAAAMNEQAEYERLRNRYLAHRREREPVEGLTAEQRARAQELRQTPRTGRKPKKERSDWQELHAEAGRQIYAERRCCYTTARMAQLAASKAKHKNYDTIGRAGVLPQWLQRDGDTVRYCGTEWTIHRRQLARRPWPTTPIVQAYISRERRNCYLRRRPVWAWFLVLVVQDTAAQRAVTSPRTEAGLDLGWKQDTEGLRVADVVDESGTHTRVRMSSEASTKIHYGRSVLGLADQERDRITSVPRTVKDKRKIMHMASEADQPIAAHMAHLVEYGQGLVRRGLRRRDAEYMQVAHELCRRYHTIHVEALHGGTMARAGIGGSNRQESAPFTFLAFLRRIAPRYATVISDTPAAYTSRICECGADMGPSSDRERVCGECGQIHDRDRLAASNILTRGTARRTDSRHAESLMM